MLNNLKAYLLAALGFVTAALLFVRGQRNTARERASQAMAEVRKREAIMESERSIERARAQSREQSKEVQREAKKRPSDKRPSGEFRR